MDLRVEDLRVWKVADEGAAVLGSDLLHVDLFGNQHERGPLDRIHGSPDSKFNVAHRQSFPHAHRR